MLERLGEAWNAVGPQEAEEMGQTEAGPALLRFSDDRVGDRGIESASDGAGVGSGGFGTHVSQEFNADNWRPLVIQNPWIGVGNVQSFSYRGEQASELGRCGGEAGVPFGEEMGDGQSALGMVAADNGEHGALQSGTIGGGEFFFVV